MDRKSDIAARRRQLGAALATFRQAAELSQGELGGQTHYDRTSINKTEHGEQLPDRPFWQAADSLLDANGALLAAYDELVQVMRDHAEQERRFAHAAHLAQAERLRMGTLVRPPALMRNDDPTGTLDRTRVLVYQTRSPTPEEDRDLAITCCGRQELPEIDDMNRRELLRLMSMAGTLTAASEIEGRVDWERLDYFAKGTNRLDTATVDEYATLNTHLWRVFALSRAKGVAFPLVREQLDVLVNALQRSHNSKMHQRLCELTGGLFQLAGEILFDGNQYTEAVHCYTLAATASREAGAFDLWACALTRHAFVGVYERQFAKAAPMLELAAGIARRGDDTLSTRHWVSAAQAEVFAHLGELDASQRALDHSEQVCHLSGQVHNGGWLRFDESRRAAQRGTCYIALERPDLAEVALNDAVSQDLPARRRGCVLTDLAILGVQRRDLDQLVTFANAALDTVQETGSGVIARKLQGLQQHLMPLLTDHHIRRLNQEINTVTGVFA